MTKINIPTIKPKELPPPSEYQAVIYKHLKEDTCNLQVEAVAGSGKTTTLEAIVGMIDERNTIFVGCFSKDVATEFSSRFPSSCTCKTLHSMGLGLIKSSGMWVKINNRKVDNLFKYKILGYDYKKGWANVKSEDKEFYDTWKKEILQLVSLFKGLGVESVEGKEDKLQALSRNYGIDLPDGREYSTFIHFVMQLYQMSLEQVKVIDFDDMLLFPVVMDNIQFPFFNYILIDEAQDLNQVQRMFIKKLAGGIRSLHSIEGDTPTIGRVIVVGDSKQSIYGFRGANLTSMQDFATDFQPLHLPLSICYRCSKDIVAKAKEFCPNIEPSPDASPGLVESIGSDTFYELVQPQDFVLCRTNAPLVEECLALLEKGFNARIRGADITENLIQLCRQIDKHKSICEHAINDWWEGKKQELEQEKKFYVIGGMQNKIDILQAMKGRYENLDGIVGIIQKIFSDKGTDSIVLSTVHKVKGMEANRVFIIRPDLFPHPMAKQEWEIEQENNLQYVAWTRAKKELYFVTED